MHDDDQLTDIIVFETPEFDEARRLAERLEDRWACHACEKSDVAVVGVFLPPDKGAELAVLLHDVADWIGERSLGGVVFWLDGRGYILPGCEALWPPVESTVVADLTSW
jgi:hypothetical protein